MVKYAEISDKWFRLRLPKGISFEEYESEPCIEDRARVRDLLRRMAEEAPLTAQRLFGIKVFPTKFESLRKLDEFLSPEVASEWIRHSDPADPNNEFKLTISEFSVHFGDTVINALGGSWRYARDPNFFQSVVVTEEVTFFVFDSLMKKCSDDFGDERLTKKFKAYVRSVNRIRNQLKFDE
jgi:hypothetical protein